MKITRQMPLQRVLEAMRSLPRDRQGAAAVEFAIILPMMLALMFGSVEISYGISADRKAYATARALSDIISQAITVKDGDFTTTFGVGKSVMYPLDTSQLTSVISEVKVDADKKATIVWSKADGTGATARADNQTVTASIPANLLVANTYLIWSEVNYAYKPAIPMFITGGKLNMKHEFYTRPRQSNCVAYAGKTC